MIKEGGDYMYHGKYEARHLQRRHKRRSKKTGMLFLSLLLVATMMVGGTLAWLSTKDAPIQNTFLPTKVTCKVTESFDGRTGVKSNVNVENTGDIDAYIRVKLVTYRTNDQGQHIGGTASLPTFTLGANWVSYDGYYYYTLPVAPGERPETNLTDSMMLIDSYTDADGGKQAIDVMAEAIQSVPEDAVKAAWGEDFSIDADGSLSVPSN